MHRSTHPGTFLGKGHPAPLGSSHPQTGASLCESPKVRGHCPTDPTRLPAGTAPLDLPTPGQPASCNPPRRQALGGKGGNLGFRRPRRNEDLRRLPTHPPAVG